MALTHLPEEIIEKLVEEFSVKDLLACSAVSLQWREKFNIDAFWRKFCFREIKDYLEDFPCEVDPTFALPEDKEERLQTLCSWRIHYMRKVHLLNNWKSNKFSPFAFRAHVGVISSDVKIDCDGIHWLFIRTEYEIEVWNINTTPLLHAKIPIFVDCPNTSLFIARNKLIISQWNVSSIYNLQSNRESNILFRFLLEEEKPLPLKFWNTTKKLDISINEDDDFRFINFGNVLVGYKRIPNPVTDSSMHLWDMCSGEKQKIVSMSTSLSVEDEIAFTNIFRIDDLRGMIRHVFRSPDDIMCSKLVVFDFKRERLTDTDITFEGVTVWCGYAQGVIVTFTSHPGTIRFFNYPTGKLLSVKEIGEWSNSEQMQLIDSYLLYCMFNCMNVLDIHKQEVVYCLAFSFYSFVRRLTVVEPRFIVVWLLERGGSPGCPSYYQEVWDLKDLSNKLFSCSSDLGYEMVTNSSSIVKQVISYNGMISVYTFW
uniref:F-box domain-containing protein n=1 Tax=Graphocephala atropunctata TaxID=36148 RepID=A0A1B6MPD8_9HEMI